MFLLMCVKVSTFSSLCRSQEFVYREWRVVDVVVVVFVVVVVVVARYTAFV